MKTKAEANRKDKHIVIKQKQLETNTETKEIAKHRHTIVRQQHQRNEETIGTSKNRRANTETYL